MAQTKLLSVIVPAYKQEKTIGQDLKSINQTLEAGLPSDFDFEIICVVDGILDDTYKEALKVKSFRIKVFGYKENQGKGYAVRFGMSKAKGGYISFLDAGRDINARGMMMLMAHMDWYNADVIVGSKRHPASIVKNYPFVRKLYTVGYHVGVRVLFGLPLKDTQSGIKIFKRKVIEAILPRLLVKRHAMDIEMLAVAWHLGFKRIYEAPIEVRFDKSVSSIGFRFFGANSASKMLWDTLAVFYRLHLLHYYDDKNKTNWLRV